MRRSSIKNIPTEVLQKPFLSLESPNIFWKYLTSSRLLLDTVTSFFIDKYVDEYFIIELDECWFGSDCNRKGKLIESSRQICNAISKVGLEVSIKKLGKYDRRYKQKQQLFRFLSVRHTVKNLDLTLLREIDVPILQAMKNQSNNIQYLFLNGISIRDNMHFAMMMKNLKILKHLNIKRCNIPNILKIVGENCSVIEKVLLTSWNSIPDHKIKALVNTLTNLTILNSDRNYEFFGQILLILGSKGAIQNLSKS